MELNYRKNNNKQLFETISNTEFLDITNIQNYFPLYNYYFDLNSNNYNTINLNNSYKLEAITNKINYNKFVGTICDLCNNKLCKNIFKVNDINCVIIILKKFSNFITLSIF
jgi:hypothetical protein